MQRAGGAGLFPLSFAILFAAFRQEERGKANGIFGIPVLVAPAIGPTLGGYLTQYVDWRWVFFVNLPVGILGVLLGARVLRLAKPQPDLRLDRLGFLIAAAGLGLPLLLQSTNTTALDGITGPTLPEATTLNVVVRNVIASFAIAALTNVLQARAQTYLARAGGGRSPPVGTPLAGKASAAIINAQALAFHDIFLLTAALLPALALAIFLRSPEKKGDREERAGGDRREAEERLAAVGATREER